MARSMACAECNNFQQHRLIRRPEWAQCRANWKTNSTTDAIASMPLSCAIRASVQINPSEKLINLLLTLLLAANNNLIA